MGGAGNVPRRQVVEAMVDEVTTGLLRGPRRTKRWWVLRLECGHVVERPVRYSRERSRYVHGGGRSAGDALAAPMRVQCGECATP